MTGVLMAAEMAEQPGVLAGVLSRAEADAADLRAVLPGPLAGTMFLARGSSDNAAVFGRYLVECAAPATYGPKCPTPGITPRWTGRASRVALSQSGATPEIVRTCAGLRAAGAVVIGLTNLPGSPLAQVVDRELLARAGQERAVPATKTVTAQLTLLVTVVLSTAVAGRAAHRHARAGRRRTAYTAGRGRGAGRPDRPGCWHSGGLTGWARPRPSCGAGNRAEDQGRPLGSWPRHLHGRPARPDRHGLRGRTCPADRGRRPRRHRPRRPPGPPRRPRRGTSRAAATTRPARDGAGHHRSSPRPAASPRARPGPGRRPGRPGPPQQGHRHQLTRSLPITRCQPRTAVARVLAHALGRRYCRRLRGARGGPGSGHGHLRRPPRARSRAAGPQPGRFRGASRA